MQLQLDKFRTRATTMGLIMASVALSGCGTTSLKVSRLENSTSPRDGIVYFLPFTQFETKLTWVLSCAENTNTAGVAMKIEATPKTAPDPDGIYVIDYQSLSAFAKTSEVKVDFYDSGSIKSINASADDKSAEIVTKTISAVGNVAKFAFLPGTANTPDKLFSDMARQQILSCSTAAIAALDDLSGKKRALAATTAELAEATTQLEQQRVTVASAGDAVSRRARQNLDRAIRKVAALQLDVDLKKKAVNTALAAVTHSVTTTFPNTSSIVSTAASGGFKIPENVLAGWLDTAQPSIFAEGMNLPEPKKNETQDEANSRVWSKAVSDSLSAYANKLTGYLQLVSRGSNPASLPADPDDAKASGIAYRVGLPGFLKLCKTNPCNDDLFPGVLVKSIPVTVLQRNSTFYLPFKSKPFTNGGISATFSEAGVLTSAGYEQKRAVGEALADIATSLTEQGIAVGTAIRDAKKSELDKIKDETELAKAQKELEDAQKALAESPNQEITNASEALAADTALKQQELANINAEIALRKAREELAAAGGTD